MAKGYYKSVPGSRDLLTRSPKSDEAILKIERELEKAESLGPFYEYGDETLGGVMLKGKMIAIPEEVFDLFLSELEPIEQSVYLQLFRLSYARSRNFCRVGKKDLARRTRLSLLRLNAALEGLARKKMIKPLHRSVKGTLWRVYHPAELGKTADYEIVQGTRVKIQVEKPRKTRAAALPRKPLESPLNVDRFAGLSKDQPEIPLRKMAERFFELKGGTAGDLEMDEALAVITGLLEDGFSRKQVMFALQWFRQKFPKEKDLSRLPYYITRALEEFKA